MFWESNTFCYLGCKIPFTVVMACHHANLSLRRPYFFIERAGRRKVLILSSAACSFCMVMISIMLRINTTAVSHIEHLSPDFH